MTRSIHILDENQQRYCHASGKVTGTGPSQNACPTCEPCPHRILWAKIWTPASLASLRYLAKEGHASWFGRKRTASSRITTNITAARRLSTPSSHFLPVNRWQCADHESFNSFILSIDRFLTLCDFRQFPDVLDGPGGDDLLAVWALLVAAAPREDSGPLKDSGRCEKFSRHSKFRESITSHLVGL